MVKPVTLACGHSGCRHCLATLIGIETFPKCPLCKAPIGTDVTLHVNVALDDIIGDFNVKCNKSGCLWKGKFHEHEQHLKRCGKFQTACANDGCGEMVARRGWQHTLRNVQSTNSLASNAVEKLPGNLSRSILLPFAQIRGYCAH
ncbi:unnamed protein product [Pocillopora meandrina]|uniref:Zinc finger C3HC4 RING-type domain-containing protein n=1 Tax=Pocillopora meandrina TaxID=46732 RepID=A0AAU9W9U4_9CNID|nr:unnamed protein product [Pocillopora meandrina]CAH3167248.1 unnamed protein product [Pocillopora meandrina]